MKLKNNLNNLLNNNLRELLTLINQYFLHARMLQDWGFNRLGEQNYKYSIEVMKDSDKIIKRILFLEGLPNLQDLGKLFIGEEASETNALNHKHEIQFRELLQSSIKEFEEKQDYISRDLLQQIMDRCEERIDYFETQDYLISHLGKENYYQSII